MLLTQYSELLVLGITHSSHRAPCQSGCGLPPGLATVAPLNFCDIPSLTSPTLAVKRSFPIALRGSRRACGNPWVKGIGIDGRQCALRRYTVRQEMQGDWA